ncbi:hypothetical protein BX616_011017 [Lobosporangium transversale]|nr:hypothetical protein BX616_011017 [Lobosporangium transversale]
MDALAAYGSDSDDSDTESTPIFTTSARASEGAASTSATAEGITITTPSKIHSLSNLLPSPKCKSPNSTASTKTVTIPSIPKTSKYHTLPTLESDSDSDEDSEFRKKAKLAAATKNAGSGVGALFAMLPAPKSGQNSSTTASTLAKPSFMPRTIKKTTISTPTLAITSATTKGSVSGKASDTMKGEVEENQSDDEGEGETEAEEPVSFFPLGDAAIGSSMGSSSKSGKTASSTYIPLFFDKKPLTTEEREAQNQIAVDVSTTNEQYAYTGDEEYAYSGNEQYGYMTNDQYAYPTNDQYAYQNYEGYTADMNAHTLQGSSENHSSNMVELDTAALHKLGMRKARDMPINVVDISAKDQMSQAQHVRMAMGANGGQPKPVNLASIEHLKPSLGQKRKHNIMSLAYQAKANEQQLNASWAASRRTKAETQSKYGF